MVEGIEEATKLWTSFSSTRELLLVRAAAEAAAPQICIFNRCYVNCITSTISMKVTPFGVSSIVVGTRRLDFQETLRNGSFVIDLLILIGFAFLNRIQIYFLYIHFSDIWFLLLWRRFIVSSTCILFRFYCIVDAGPFKILIMRSDIA